MYQINLKFRLLLHSEHVMKLVLAELSLLKAPHILREKIIYKCKKIAIVFERLVSLCLLRSIFKL